MRVAVFSTKPYDRQSLTEANAAHGHHLDFFETRLTAATAALAAGYDAVCVFVNDQLDADALATLAAGGTRLLALRSAGFNHVDLDAAARLGITVARVPAYSPYAVAELAVALILALNRKIHRAFARVREGNFSLDGLLGFDLHGRTVGIVGTGRIGEAFARIMAGFGCQLIACDPSPSDAVRALGAQYADLHTLLSAADIVALHAPLTPDTRHLIRAETLALMKPGAMLINTSRGGLVDTRAVIAALKRRHLGALGLDVYEEEEALFFHDLSAHGIDDDVFARLVTFPNVLVTGHQGFFTVDALRNIADTTMANLTGFAEGTGPSHVVSAPVPRQSSTGDMPG